MSKHNFKVGDLVEVVEAGNKEESPGWSSHMDMCIGGIFAIKKFTRLGNIQLKGHDCNFSPSWLKPPGVAHFEKNLKVGDKVLVTKPEGETSLWTSEMDKFDGKVLKIKDSNMLHFWRLVGFCAYVFHEGWLTKVEATKETHTEDLQKSNEELKKENAALSESLEGQRVENEVLKDNLESLRQQHEELRSKHGGVNFLAVTPMNHIYRF